MVWTQEDIDKVRKFIDIKNRGHYVETHELTDVYNRVLEKRVTNTTCGSCLRQRVLELEKALKQYEIELAKKEQEALENAKMSGFNTVEEAIIESETIMREHEEEIKEKENVTERKTSGTAKKGKTSKSKTA